MPDGTLPLRANFPAAAVGFALYGPAEIPTPEDLANFLLIHGCDPSELPALGGKTLNDLFAEVAAGEVRLGLQLIVRHVVSAAVSIRVPTLPVTYHEIKRTFPGGKKQSGRKTWTIRETVRAGEEPAAAAVRGLAEELDFWNRVPFATPSMLVARGTTVHTAPSAAYAGLLSERQIHSFILDLPALPWAEEIIEYQDECGTTITIERFSDSPIGATTAPAMPWLRPSAASSPISNTVNV